VSDKKVLCGLFILFSLCAIQSTSAVAVDLIQAESGEMAMNAFVRGLDPKQSCTIIYASDGQMALAGNNEDWTNPFPIIWFLPAENGKFGRVYVGFNTNYPQGGMNEKGLFYDGATAEVVDVPRDPKKRDYEGSLIGKAMEECSSVEEVLKLFTEYNCAGRWNGQYFVADRYGNSAIIEPLTFIRKTRHYQAVTNFLQSKTDPETSTDARYRLASKLFEQSDTISVGLFRRILDDVHSEDYGGSWNVTLYSNIFDLITGDIYLYNFHNYDNEVKLNIHEELKKGRHSYLLSSLFPYETYAARQYRATRATVMLIEKAEQNGVSGEDGAIAFYKKLKSADGNPVKYNLEEKHLTAAGYALIEKNKVDKAVELFKFMIEEYPQSATAYASLADAYRKSGNKELAIKNYKKSLELNPNSDNAKKRLEQLQK
jgi:tetratricopeptide (TPR) repeat protein